MSCVAYVDAALSEVRKAELVLRTHSPGVDRFVGEEHACARSGVGLLQRWLPGHYPVGYGCLTWIRHTPNHRNPTRGRYPAGEILFFSLYRRGSRAAWGKSSVVVRSSTTSVRYIRFPLGLPNSSTAEDPPMPPSNLLRTRPSSLVLCGRCPT